RLLHDRPGELLLVVPFLARRTQDVLGELVDPVLDLDLVVVELERELGHRGSSGGRSGSGWHRRRSATSPSKLPMSNPRRPAGDLVRPGVTGANPTDLSAFRPLARCISMTKRENGKDSSVEGAKPRPGPLPSAGAP